MALALLLLGLNHNERNQKPLRYVLCLLLLCMTSAYGIIVAGGICIVCLIIINLNSEMLRAPADSAVQVYGPDIVL